MENQKIKKAAEEQPVPSAPSPTVVVWTRPNCTLFERQPITHLRQRSGHSTRPPRRDWTLWEFYGDAGRRFVTFDIEVGRVLASYQERGLCADVLARPVKKITSMPEWQIIFVDASPAAEKK